MAILKFEGSVSTNKVGSECKFTFEIDEEDLPENTNEREHTLNEIALEALWESGQIDWGYEQIGTEEKDSED